MPNGVAPASRYDFLLSYAPEDVEWALWVGWRLEEARHASGRFFRVYVPAWDQVAGTNVVAGVQSGLEQAERVVAILSGDYLTQVGPQAGEWHAAFRNDPDGRERTLIPVRIQPCEPTGLIGNLRYIDLVGLAQPNAEARLTDEILGALAGRAKPTSAPRFPGAAASGPPTPTRARRSPPPFPGPSRTVRGVS